MAALTAAAGDWPRRLMEVEAAASRGPAAVIDLLAPAARDPAAPPAALRSLATALRQARRNAEAAPVLARLVEANPASAVAEHNLAAALGDTGDAPAAEAAARRALAKGGDAPETWLVLARALVAQGRLDDGDAALGEALTRRPLYADALRDRAQLAWMRNGDAAAALAPLDRLLATSPSSGLAALKAGVARDIVGPRAAYDGLVPWLGADDPAVLSTATAAAAEIDPALALRHAEAAVALAPGDPRLRVARLAALIAAGQTPRALKGLDAHLGTAPFDQYALALRDVARRVLGDARALGPGDYRALVGVFDLVPPSGEDRVVWLDRVAEGLGRLHPFRAEPLGQSIRAGAQAALDPRFAADPAIDSVFAALEEPLRTYRSAMSDRDDPMSVRRGAGHEIVGAWSVRLTAGGRHSDHIHPEGWVSSALYVQVPRPSPGADRAGWIRFGAVRLGVGFELPALHWVEPRPGRVVLFPSHVWHGTEPFSGEGARLTIAFDLQPR